MSTRPGGPNVLQHHPDAPACEPSPPAADPWARLAAELQHPDVELDAETFAGVWRAFLAKKRRGPVDPVLAALLVVLNRQVLLADGLPVGTLAAIASVEGRVR